MSNFNMSWGWKQVLLTIPIMLVGFVPLWLLFSNKGDVTEELSVSEVRSRSNEGTLDITGLVTNTGDRTWSGVVIEAEFFDASGAFLDEATEYLTSEIAGKAKEHVKISVRNPSPEVLAPDTKMVVKVSGGHTRPF